MVAALTSVACAVRRDVVAFTARCRPGRCSWG